MGESEAISRIYRAILYSLENNTPKLKHKGKDSMGSAMMPTIMWLLPNRIYKLHSIDTEDNQVL